ncbi:MAG: VCBS repeat-containing protein [Balneolaceae bacterium]|nr:VCBS repeat-containing protein [Balneolaceae bacterium]
MKSHYQAFLFLLATVFFLLPGSVFSQTIYRDVTSTHVPEAPDLHALDAAFADVDSDGDLDIALAVEMGPNRLYLNDGKGHLTWKRGAFGQASHDTEHVNAADFNTDGRIDFIFVAEDDQTHQLFYGTGKGGFSDESDRLLSMSEGNGLAVCDLNGDGLPDVVVGNTGVHADNNQNFLWLNDPDNPGHFLDATKSHLPQVNDDTQDVTLADLDGDGDLDMVVGNENPPNKLYLNDGRGHFTDESERLELVTPLETRQAHVTDFTGDQRPDILFLNLTSNNSGWVKDPRVRLLVQSENGRFRDETEDRLPYNSFSVYEGTPVDLNRDGAVDIVVGPIQIPGFIPLQFRAYINDGNGFFSDETEDYIPDESTGRGWGMEVGDLNGDGLNDIFIGGWGTQARLLLAQPAP